MSIGIWYLLAAYGLCFGIQNKFPFGLIYDKHPLLDRMLGCSYCTGFHCGWFMWLVYWAINGVPPVTTNLFATLVSIPFWGILSAAFCYSIDVLISWLETRTSLHIGTGNE